MSKYNILFCDDDDAIIEFYQNLITENEKIKEIINEPYFSSSFNKNIGDLVSVKNICLDIKKHDEILDIAILDINFNNIKAFEELEDNASFEVLGVLICKYITNQFPTSQIIFVSGNPAYVKETHELYSSNIHFIEKKGTLLEKEIEEKIFEIIEKKQTKADSIKISYLYDIDFITPKGNDFHLNLKNPRVKKGNEELEIEIKLNTKPFKILSALILNCCYDKKNNKIEKKPKGINSNTLEKALSENEELNNRLIDTHIEFLSDLFKKFANSSNPACNFDLAKAKRYGFGFKSDLRKRDTEFNENCKTSCEIFLKNYKICPINLSITEQKTNNVSVTKDINFLRTRMKEEIDTVLKSLKELDSYKWVDGKDISLNCNCNKRNDEIMTCTNPFCTYSIIFSDKLTTGSASTKYNLLLKPTHRIIEYVKDFSKE